MKATLHDPYAATVTDATGLVDASIVIPTYRRTHLLPLRYADRARSADEGGRRG
jgi:hypothetical protein